jgi:chemotaxis-related protein WspB
MLMLLFQLGNSQYALSTREVVEVAPQVKLDPIAGAPAYVAGLFNYRGQHVPIIDLCSVINNKRCGDSFTTRIILVDFPLASGGNRTLGLLAERVTETIEIEAGEFYSTGVAMTEAPFLGRAARVDAELVQRISIRDLLPEHVQSQLFPAEAG